MVCFCYPRFHFLLLLFGEQNEDSQITDGAPPFFWGRKQSVERKKRNIRKDLFFFFLVSVEWNWRTHLGHKGDVVRRCRGHPSAPSLNVREKNLLWFDYFFPHSSYDVILRLGTPNQHDSRSRVLWSGGPFACLRVKKCWLEIKLRDSFGPKLLQKPGVHRQCTPLCTNTVLFRLVTAPFWCLCVQRGARLETPSFYSRNLKPVLPTKTIKYLVEKIVISGCW